MSWTACYDDDCWVHRRDKEATYFPKPPRNKSPVVPSEWEQQFETQPPKGPRRRTHQEKRNAHARTHWTRCYQDGCTIHRAEKERNDRWPRRPRQGTGRRPWGAAWLQPEGGESEKTQPDTEALQRQIKELLEERDKDQQKIAALESTIRFQNDTIQRQRNTVQGARHMLARIEGDVRTFRRYQEKFYELRTEVRRAGRRLQDLGN